MKKIVNEEGFRIEYEQELRREGAFVEYLSTKERRGTPDEYFCWEGVAGWQELKFVSDLPAREDSGVLGHLVTGLQRQFLADVNQRGGLGVVAVGHQVLGNQLLVSLFWPDETDDKGQLTLRQLKQCPRTFPVVDGLAVLQQLKVMHDGSRQMEAERRSRRRSDKQMGFWPTNQRR